MARRPAIRRPLAMAAAVAALAVTGCGSAHWRSVPEGARLQLQRAQEAAAAKDAAAARRGFEEAAAGGHPRALLALGKFLVATNGPERDPVRAAAVFEEARGKNSPLKGEAAFQLARLYAAGDGVPQSTGQARLLFDQALALGYRPAAFELARMLEAGAGPGDIARAKQLYRQAADGGDGRASLRLAEIAIAEGQSRALVQADAAAGIEALTRRASAGEVGAMRELALIYARDTIVPPDPGRQRFWLERASNAGDLGSTVRLAALLERAGDLPQALRLYRRAGALGDAGATVWLAQHYLKAGDDPPAIAEWADRAVALGNLAVIEAYGRALIAGEAVPGDVPKGVALLDRAVAGGRRGPLMLLARLHLDGDGIPPDPGRAVELLTLAAEGGSAAAMASLARLYLAGTAVPADPVRGVLLLTRAAEGGHTGAMAQLGRLLLAGREVPADPARAVSWLQKAADAGHQGARFELARVWLLGRGVPADPGRGLTLLRQVAEA
ncbi:MAG TPA: tetratricopeptide repeat protein, partial [Geminicoccaceae bacterium]|nr:tetratricopeptide repeat protein [Geminicoccaceae bacterium]